MAKLGAYKTVVGKKDQSFLVDIDGGTADVELEVRSRKGCIVNCITRSGETVFLAEGNVVKINERCDDCRAVEIVCAGEFAWRGAFQLVFSSEVIDPTPAVVIADLTPHDDLAIAVRMEVERHLRALGDRGLLKEEVDPEELVEDLLHGDLEFDEEEDDFVSVSYEDMAEERPSGEAAVEQPSTPTSEQSEPSKSQPKVEPPEPPSSAP